MHGSRFSSGIPGPKDSLRDYRLDLCGGSARRCPHYVGIELLLRIAAVCSGIDNVNRRVNRCYNHHDGLPYVLGRGRLSPQLPLSHPNRTDARWTVQKRTRPTFERLSPQLLCLYDCPALLFARTGRSLELYSRIYADLSMYARNYAKLNKTFITRRGYVRFR